MDGSLNHKMGHLGFWKPGDPEFQKLVKMTITPPNEHSTLDVIGGVQMCVTTECDCKMGSKISDSQ